MKIVNVSGIIDLSLPSKVFYTVIDQNEFDGIEDREDVEISASSWDTEEGAIEHCKDCKLFPYYIARVEIVAKTV